MSRHELKRQLMLKVVSHAPHLMGSVTGRMVSEGAVFATGYLRCLETNVEEPFSEAEVMSLVYSEAISYVMKKFFP